MRKKALRLQLHICSVLLLGLLASAPAFAAIPLITDDTGTQGRGKFQLELSGESASDKDEAGTDRNAGLTAALTFGVADAADVVFSVPYASWRSDDSGATTSESGYSDLAVEAKWRFYGNKGFSLALKPGFTIPTGDEKKDLGNGEMTYYLFFIASREAAPWTFHLNLAYLRNNNSREDREHVWHASFASTFALLKDLKLVGDVGIETNPEESSNTPPVYALAGAIYSLSGNFDLGLGLKAGLTSPEPDLAVRGGITYRF